nr:MAG TPA: hypothetical protein [Caudoviricetes sp.]
MFCGDLFFRNLLLITFIKSSFYTSDGIGKVVSRSL